MNERDVHLSSSYSVTVLETALAPIGAVLAWVVDAASTMGFYYEPAPTIDQEIGFFAVQFGFIAIFACLGMRFYAGGRVGLAWFFFALGFLTVVPFAAFDASRRP